MRRVVATLVLIMASGPAFAGSDSVVGRWSEPGSSCVGAGVTTIRAMSLSNGDVDCRFKTVKRKGASVTWQGVCDDAEGSSEQSVKATLKGKRLTYRFTPGGNWVGPLRRCP